MPQFETTTKAVRSVWKSPDGQREIFEVMLDYEGQQVKAKTYSKDIANEGWAGTVETYEKQGRNGSETFVKQPPKEGFGAPSQGSHQSSTGRSSYTPKDEKAIQAMWAIGQAVNATGPRPQDVEVSTYTAVVYDTAIELFNMVDVVKGEEKPAETADTVTEPADETQEDLLKNIDEVFGTKEEKPWPPKS